ncbi:MAG: HupE/UreJ family protein [Flavobacteriaceae bacterium]|nr:HupE/UreJ family protein [Flavobacteriaceae bacterium]
MYDLVFYLELGLFHVLDWNAIDHMLFLSALTIVHSFKDYKTVFWVVTSFTLGHTFSLILSAFDILKPPSETIEFLIPVTIILTSVYNILNNQVKTYKLLEYGFSIFFGLIHGFGFGNYFEMLTDSTETKITPLLGFAFGVEMSQLVVVLVILIINFIVIRFNFLKRINYINTCSLLIILLSLKLIYQMI